MLHIEAGRIKAIAIGTKKRSDKIPDVPTLGEVLNDTDYEVTVWYGLLAPKGTPPEIIDRLAKEVKTILDIPDIQQKIVNTGSEVSPMDRQEFTAFIRQENETWGALVRELDLLN